MNPLIETLNRFGQNALHFAWPMLWQSSVLIAILFIADFTLRRRVRAAVRYALWLVLLVKLLLPPSLALPTGVVWWLFPAIATPAKPQTTRYVVSYGADTTPNLPLQPMPAFTPPPRLPVSVAAWTVLAWSAVSLGLLFWLTLRWRQVACDVRRATPAPAWLGELFEEVKYLTGVRGTVRLGLTDRAMSPAVCGLFRPVILLPLSLVEKLSPTQLRAVLLHELTHLRRGDVWMNCAQALVQIVYWWHPLLWFANSRIRRVREEAVDDAVMLALRDEAETYAPTLLEVAKLAFHRPLASLCLVGILESRSALRQRVERLMDFRAPCKAGLTLLSFFGILAFTALAVPMGAAPASQNSRSPNKIFAEPSATNIYTRGFMVNRGPGLAGLQKRTGLTDSSPPDKYLREFSKLLAGSGTILPPTSFWFKDNGLLLVRGTPQQLDAVEQMVTELNGFPAQKTREVAVHKFIVNNANSTSAETGNPVKLETRTFKVDQNTFYLGLQSLGTQNIGSASPIGGDGGGQNGTPSSPAVAIVNAFPEVGPTHSSGGPAIVTTTDQTANISQAAKRFFTKLGLNLDPPKSVFFNEGLGLLFVRATEQDLDTVESAVQVLNMTAPQIHIKARFIEVPEPTPQYFGTYLIPTGATNVAGILTDPNFRVVIHSLEQSQGFENLAEPEVTTLNGRQTQMRATTIFTIVTNFAYRESSAKSGIIPQTTEVECGPVLDVIASALPDGYTIDLKVTASLKEFSGYDKTTNTVQAFTATGNRVDLPEISPRFHAQESDAHIKLLDNQTVVLGGLAPTQVQSMDDKVPMLDDIPLLRRLFQSQSKTTVGKHLMIFVTITMVDLVGNRTHSDDEIAQKQHSAAGFR